MPIYRKKVNGRKVRWVRVNHKGLNASRPSYGPHSSDMYRRAASYVDRIAGVAETPDWKSLDSPPRRLGRASGRWTTGRQSPDAGRQS